MPSIRYLLLVWIIVMLSIYGVGCGGDDDPQEDGDLSEAESDATQPDGDDDMPVIPPDGDTADGDTADGDTADGDTADGDLIDGDKVDGDWIDGDGTDGDMVDGDGSDGDWIDGDWIDGDGEQFCSGCEEFAGTYCVAEATGSNCDAYPVEMVSIEEDDEIECGYTVTVFITGYSPQSVDVVGCDFQDESVLGVCSVSVDQGEILVDCSTICSAVLNQEACLTDGDGIDGDFIDGDVIDGDVIDGDVVDGDVIDGDVIDGDMIDGDVIDGDVIDGDVIDGDVIDGDVIDGDVIDGDIIDGDIIEYPAPAPGDVIFTEFLANTTGSVAEQLGEWMEVVNLTNETFGLGGLNLCDAVDGNCEVLPANLVIGPYEALIFAGSDDSGVNGGLTNVAYDFGFSLNNSGDKLRLIDGSPADGVLIDEVDASTWDQIAGVSWQLDPAHFDVLENDDASYWCLGSLQYLADGPHYGTPGTMNVSCEIVDGDGVDGDVIDGDMVDGDIVDGDIVDGDIVDGDMVDGDMIDGDIVDGDIVDGDMVDGDIVDGDIIDGDVVDGDVVDGDMIDGDMIDGDMVDGDVIDGDVVDCYGYGDCNAACINAGYDSGVCVDAIQGCTCNYASCEAYVCGTYYDNCSCAAADPCNWQGDDYCDDFCALVYPDDHFDDSADCSVDGDIVDGDMVDGDIIDGDVVDGDVVDGDVIDGDIIDGDIIDGDVIDGDVVDCYGYGDCNAACIDAGYDSGVCVDAIQGCTCNYASCEAYVCGTYYDNCSCAAADPCNWQGDDYCDDFCALVYPDDHFDDSADCSVDGDVIDGDVVDGDIVDGDIIDGDVVDGDIVPLSGENCGNAIAITGLPYSDTGEMANYMNDVFFSTNGESCTGYTNYGKDVLYAVELEAGQILNASLDANFDSALYLLNNCVNGELPAEMCVEGSDSGNPETLSVEIQDAGTYYLVVDYWNSSGPSSGSYELSVWTGSADGDVVDGDIGPLSGDNCGNAISITGLPYSDTGEMANYLNDVFFSSNDESCTGYVNSGKDVIYAVELEAGQALNASLDADFDSALYLLSNCLNGELASELCVEGSDSGNPETLSVVIQNAGTYYLVVDYWNSGGPSSGSYELSVWSGSVDGDVIDGDVIDGDVVDGDVIDGDVVDGDVVDGDVVSPFCPGYTGTSDCCRLDNSCDWAEDGWCDCGGTCPWDVVDCSVDGDIIDGDVVDGDMVDGDVIDGDMVDGDVIDGDIIDGDVHPDDNYEDNDSFEEAVEGPLSITPLFLADNDDDYFYYDVCPGGTITTDVYFLHEDLDIDIILRDSSSSAIGYGTSSDDNEHITWINSGAETERVVLQIGRAESGWAEYILMVTIEDCDVDGDVIDGDVVDGDIEPALNWVRLYPDTVPTARFGHNMAYNPDTGNTLMAFGQGSYTTMYEWDGSNWNSVVPAHRPTAYRFNSMVYHEGLGKMVLFGGNTCCPNVSYAETWLFDGTDWEQLITATTPPERQNAVMAYDSIRDVIVMHGGSNYDDTTIVELNDTWEFDGTDWNQVVTDTTGPTTNSAAMAFDPILEKMVLVDGTDTWLYDGTDWEMISPATVIGHRSSPVLAFDTWRGVTVLFGGNSSYGTFEFDGTDWTEITTEDSPPLTLNNGFMVFDPIAGHMLLFGGSGCDSGYCNETWIYGPESIVDGDVVDGDIVDGDIVDGDIVDGDIVDGDIVDGDVVDGDVIDGDIVDGDMVDGDVVDGDVVDGDIVDGDVDNSCIDDLYEPNDNDAEATSGNWYDWSDLVICGENEDWFEVYIDHSHYTNHYAGDSTIVYLYNSSLTLLGSTADDPGSFLNVQDCLPAGNYLLKVVSATGSDVSNYSVYIGTSSCTIDGDIVDGDVVDGDIVDGDIVDGDVVDGDVVDCSGSCNLGESDFCSDADTICTCEFSKAVSGSWTAYNCNDICEFGALGCGFDPDTGAYCMCNEPDGDVVDGDIVDGDIVDGDIVDGDIVDGDIVDGDVVDGDIVDGDAGPCPECADFPGQYCILSQEGAGCAALGVQYIVVSEDPDTECGFIVTSVLDGQPNADIPMQGCTFVNTPFGDFCTITSLPDGTFTADCSGMCSYVFSKDVCVPDGDVVDGDVADGDVDTTLGLPTEAGQLVITEIMNNPSVISDTFGEWFEVYNPTSLTFDLNGLSIQDAGSDNVTVEGSLLIGPHEYLVFGNNSDTGTNSGVVLDYAYAPDAFYLGNSDDEIHLYSGDTLIDAVEYDNGATFPDPIGHSMYLDALKIGDDNNDGTNWCQDLENPYGVGDNYGTPGVVNPRCPMGEILCGEGIAIDLINGTRMWENYSQSHAGFVGPESVYAFTVPDCPFQLSVDATLITSGFPASLLVLEKLDPGTFMAGTDLQVADPTLNLYLTPGETYYFVIDTPIVDVSFSLQLSIACNCLPPTYRVHYFSGWTPPYMHYSPDLGTTWTDLPGAAMTAEGNGWWFKDVYSSLVLPLTFVFNDGADNWDNPPGGGNYTTLDPEVWVKDGVIYTSMPVR